MTRTSRTWQHGIDTGIFRTPLRWGTYFRRVVDLCFLFVLSAGLVQFAMLVWAGQVLHDASRAGIRESTLPGATVASVTSTARRRLAPSVRGMRAATVRVRVNGRLGPANRSLASGDRVVVTIELPADLAAANWLGYVGVRPAGRTLRARTVMTRP